MNRKLNAMLLILALILPALFACGGNGGNSDDPTDTGGSGQTTAADVTGETERLAPNLPEKDLGGQEFMFYVMGYDRNVNNYSIEIYSESETGDTIKDAVYKRNAALEEKYNFKIAEFPEKNSSLADTVRNTLLAGGDEYQVLMMNLRDSVSLAQHGLLHDLNSVENIDLVQPWWDSESNNDFSIVKKTYFAVGDINIMDNNATWAVFFNKKLVGDLGMDMPYKYVNENTWTLDKYYEMSLAAAKDLDGDEVMNPDTDRWGTVGDYMNTYMLYIAGGERITVKDSDGIPVMSMLNDRSPGVVDKVLDIQLDLNSTLHANKHEGKYGNVYSDLIRKNFKEDRALFYIAGLLSYTLLRDMESEFGMVPMPKFDSAQENYYTTYNPNNASALSIPVSNKRLADTGFVVEAMAAESLYTLTPAYYEIALERKYMHDTESKEMLDIILSSRTFDLAANFNWGNAYSIFDSLTSRGVRTFVSDYEKVQVKAEEAIAKTIDAFENFGKE